MCVCVCVRLNNSGTAGPIWLNFFLLALSWSEGGFRPKNFRIRIPVCTEKLAGHRPKLRTVSHLLVVGFEVAGGGQQKKFNSWGLVRDAGVLKS